MAPCRVAMYSLLVIALCALVLSTCGDEKDEGNGFTVVELDAEAATPLQLAVMACVGLHNRTHGGSIYVQKQTHNEEWLDELNLEPSQFVSATDFLQTCLDAYPVCVRYNFAEQQELLPSILTAASALEAVPLDVELTVPCDNVVFDATDEFEERNTPYLSTEYVFERFAAQTTGLAMLDPGYNPHPEDHSNPDLTGEVSLELVDYVFSQKLFVVYLVNGCRENSPERELLQEIVNANHWPTPLGVFGYNRSWWIAGCIYEAQTLCLNSRNMGAIPTETNNLSFFSTRREPIVDANELARNEPEEIEYDPDTTYVAFVIGDGDNISFIMSTRNVWLRQRLAHCAQTDNACAPLTWSISPHLPTLAPDVLEWYYELSRQTGKDYFILPPSGHLYAYPTSLTDEEQARFVSATEQDARILGTSGVVHWDVLNSWVDAEERFLPRYARADGVIRGVFPINVPYFMPIFDWAEDQFYKVLVGEDGSRLVLFRDQEWRGVDDNNDPFQVSPQVMAERLGSYPPGTITWVYMTSDGGLDLENSFIELTRILPSHVQLVSSDAATRLALEADATRGHSP